jgi:hypothetical protein
VLPVAEIFSVLSAERAGREVVATVIVGDADNTPKSHGLRAPRARWVQLFSMLSAEDPALGDALREALASERAPRLRCTGCDNNGCPDCVSADQARHAVLKPGGQLL